MKITDVRVDRLKVRGTLVRVFTDEGLVGLGWEILPSNGTVTLPAGPGLGLELDDRALERLLA